MACWLDEERKKADKPRMLELLHQLNARIAKLNDGPPAALTHRPWRARAVCPLTPAMGRVPKRRVRYETIVL